MIAFALDEALAVADQIAERRAMTPTPDPEDGGLRPGERHATDEDYDDEDAV